MEHVSHNGIPYTAADVSALLDERNAAIEAKGRRGTILARVRCILTFPHPISPMTEHFGGLIAAIDEELPNGGGEPELPCPPDCEGTYCGHAAQTIAELARERDGVRREHAMLVLEVARLKVELEVARSIPAATSAPTREVMLTLTTLERERDEARAWSAMKAERDAARGEIVAAADRFDQLAKVTAVARGEAEALRNGLAVWLIDHASGKRADFYAPSKSGRATLENAAAAIRAGKFSHSSAALQSAPAQIAGQVVSVDEAPAGFKNDP